MKLTTGIFPSNEHVFRFLSFARSNNFITFHPERANVQVSVAQFIPAWIRNRRHKALTIQILN